MNNAINLINSDNGIGNIKLSIKEFHAGLKVGRKISYFGQKYQILDIDTFSLRLVHDGVKGQKPIIVDFLELFSLYGEGKCRLLDKFHSKNKKVITNTTEKVVAITEQKEEEIMAIRRKYLIALGISLHVNYEYIPLSGREYIKKGVEKNVDELLNNIDTLIQIDYKKGLSTHELNINKEALQKAEEIGKIFADQSWIMRNRYSNIGYVIIALLSEDIKTGQYYRILDGLVGFWTAEFGLAKERFNEILKEL